MSQLNFLDKLLAGAEVEWCRLEKVVKIKHGKDWKDLNAGNIPVYGSGGIMGYVDQYSYDKPTVLIPRKGSITNIFFVETPFWNVDTIYYTEIDTSKVLPKYLYHYVKTIDLMALDTGSGRPSLTQAILNQIPIPIPCPENPKKSLEVQVEIVRILDAFTELTARKKQYSYYRDQLLSFKEGEVEWKTLGETCDVYTGGEAPESSSMSKAPTDIYKYPIFGNGAEVYGYTDRYRIDKDAVTISSIGANTGTIYFRKAYFTPIIRLKVVIPKQEGILPRYLFHALSSIAIGSKSSSVPNMNAADVKRISIPVPSINNQARIATILDKFDALTNSISEGLPREIKLRQKQYEYYRELLLSFPKPDGTT
ncbi:restriction endonuclease subunit S [Leptospira borgpetersenii]|uniref:restriction endonuclease subunit S n=1 Tax=Leptospira borgpetersenii TaxID=174 RepID=UPI0018828DFA|nr:restriction endonuclease subunit S [Leptospira borgpetersenii]MBE8365405.1 restriction endonuclease subunit S [Leptospira borgpetersenii serovar Balcanica]MBE8367546.1 restriction endonuclease subunit S [Leptospira borgpetersenii serovar Balcanica]MBE8424567.1 restriction endonuclease subunit S [Leptospira borgpetersenii serovar Balcanica]MBF3351650.1 restriction endonuclease subunit S [Leptospira borgpetersenii serovar Balcanica]